MNFDEAIHTFVSECRELLNDMESSLLQVSLSGDVQACVNAVFRAAHTIKGSAGLFGLDAIVAFTHVAESLLDEVRAGQVRLSEELVQVLLRTCDHMHNLVDAVEQGRADALPASVQAQGEALVAQMQMHMVAAEASLNEAPTQLAQPSPQQWHIAVHFGPSVLQNGMDPLSFLRYLASLGRVVHVDMRSEHVPSLLELDAEQCYLGFVVHLESASSQADIEGVFEFVRDDCQLCVTPLSPQVPACSPSGDVASACGSLQCTPGPNCTSAADVPVAICPAAVSKELVSEAVVVASSRNTARGADAQTVRVDAHKLDRLIDLVGELIIASAGATEVARSLRQPELLEANITLGGLVEQVRDQALQLRMVKIGATFNRFQRVVHDVARELGKDIVLEVSGEDTELDKTVVEKIADPLTHLVRNAMDHGIESAHERVRSGKPAQGTVRLNAYHDSGHIAIEISDDGGGLNRERILAKGVERGLVEPGRNLSDREVWNLIFEPGFSTAEQVTNLSGRGVGMDVVKSNITALRGTVELHSVPGQGTTVQVRLPLTLAIINGFQVRVGNSTFVVPLDVVEECVEYTGGQRHNYTDLRGSVLPFVSLREHFALHGSSSARPNIVVIAHGSQRFGLLVDELLGEAQTVIKPLSKLFSQVQGVSGTSILGNGQIALILDIPALYAGLLSSSAGHLVVASSGT